MKKLFSVFVTMFVLAFFTVTAYAQEGMGTAIAGGLFDFAETLVVPVAGAIALYLHAGIRKVLTFMDALPPHFQRIAVVATTWLVGTASSLLNVALPENLAAFDVSSYETATAAGIAMLLHEVDKRRKGG